MLVKQEPCITVGIMDHVRQIAGRFDGIFHTNDSGTITGLFSAKREEGKITLTDSSNRQIACSREIACIGDHTTTFQLFDVAIGRNFHWERREAHTYKGNLLLKTRRDGTISAINEISLEEYLISVISSEMNPDAPEEFLKAHAIVSRSWLLRGLKKTKKIHVSSRSTHRITDTEIVRWYEREDHDLFDVCADDHCQRYYGVTKTISRKAEKAVNDTRGLVAMYGNSICDTRYSKACGGITEDFRTAWSNTRIPYLTSVSDGPVSYNTISSEEDAINWIQSNPNAYCNVRNKQLLKRILAVSDRQTQNFFRWTVSYTRKELEEIIVKKSGISIGTLKEIIPLKRGPSGRISRLRIVGSHKSILVGKELEIRRWLSPTHLLSSVFFVTVEKNTRGEAQRFTFRGAGWGHGVGLCQIGAAVMAHRGFTADEILTHYFKGITIKKIY